MSQKELKESRAVVAIAQGKYAQVGTYISGGSKIECALNNIHYARWHSVDPS